MSRQKLVGLVQVYTGDGKGKTTAALGLAMRAAGSGLRVGILQFMKGNRKCGEHLFSETWGMFDIICPNMRSCFRQSREQREAQAGDALALAGELLRSGEYDVVILDEIITATSGGLIAVENVLALIKDKPLNVELVLTGRGAASEIVQTADLVTQMIPLKHPYDRGITARRGIEY
ncbi:MAG: cob(I)yrinic acid a,c-diamide adenosyltransferase [Chloroflexi bacterium]|nr:cob(I)yrinic acid a,c-diamide adenosyltransferase [Chloroflexota bacterium]MDA8188091.1 cob(I)yrinic acid a,c-diamide adenosyltransferase [Dehalococcoidales bacterium]